MKISHQLKKGTVIFLTAVLTSLSFISPTFATTDVCSDAKVPDEVKTANGCNNSSDQFAPTITGILNAIIGIAGLVAVIFIIIGGINYMTSAGDAAKVKKGKDTILYALIGLIICALSFAIVNWVILRALGGDNSGSNDKNKQNAPKTSYVITEQSPLQNNKNSIKI